jgi:hypothetical protein
MTAEVVVMNKSAVALAADSAATIGAAPKVFNGAEKLFMLIPGHAVGLMIYNNAEFMGMPWETIVKKYRDYFVESSKKLGSLQEYTSHFITFLSSQSSNLISEKQQELSLEITIDYYLREVRLRIKNNVEKYIKDNAKKITEEEITAIVDEAVEYFHKIWGQSPSKYSEDEIQEFISSLQRSYSSIVQRVRDRIFESLPLSNENRKKIEEFCYFLFYKEKLTIFHSGIVFAGFGENDLHPACEEYIVENILCNRLKYSKETELKIDEQTIGAVIPFAQKEVVYNFLSGIHPDFEDLLRGGLNGVLDDRSLRKVVSSLKGLTKERRAKLMDVLMNIKAQRLDMLLDEVQKRFEFDHTNSILKTVANLPKDELANMASTLVSLTSFMRRVSMALESVGGPIDVAVISKKDGFVWIKRKHYFDIQYNPHFNSRYSSADKEK